MLLTKSKNIIIIEGGDSAGKTQLTKYLQEYVNGKCHILHSNFNPGLPKENHFRQHKLMTKFVCKQFDSRYYTGNCLVILDRNYISDIVYGMIGYGSKGDQKYKIRRLNRLFRYFSKLSDVTVSVIYCNPSKSTFNPEAKEELVDSAEDSIIKNLYKNFFDSLDVYDAFVRNNIKFYEYDFITDPYYENLMAELEDDVKKEMQL